MNTADAQPVLEKLLAQLSNGDLGDPREDVDAVIGVLKVKLKAVLPETQQYDAGSQAISLAYQYKTRLEANADPQSFYSLDDVQKEVLRKIKCSVTVDRIANEAIHITMGSPNGKAAGIITISDDLILHWSKLCQFINECGPYDETYGAPQRNTVRLVDHIMKMVEPEAVQ